METKQTTRGKSSFSIDAILTTNTSSAVTCDVNKRSVSSQRCATPPSPTPSYPGAGRQRCTPPSPTSSYPGVGRTPPSPTSSYPGVGRQRCTPPSPIPSHPGVGVTSPIFVSTGILAGHMVSNGPLDMRLTSKTVLLPGQGGYPGLTGPVRGLTPYHPSFTPSSLLASHSAFRTNHMTHRPMTSQVVPTVTSSSLSGDREEDIDVVSGCDMSPRHISDNSRPSGGDYSDSDSLPPSDDEEDCHMTDDEGRAGAGKTGLPLYLLQCSAIRIINLNMALLTQ